MAEATKQSAAVSVPETRSTSTTNGSASGKNAPGLKVPPPLYQARPPRLMTKSSGSAAPPPSRIPRARSSSSRRKSKCRRLVHDRDQHRRLQISARPHGRRPQAAAAEHTSAYKRETGVRELIARVSESIRDWGMKMNYFATPEDASIFHDDLVHLLVHQKVAFNSPVWFNVGCDRLEPDSDARNWFWDPKKREVRYDTTGYRNPQCSACFINAVVDSLDSILTLAKTKACSSSGAPAPAPTCRPSAAPTSCSPGGGTASRPALLHAWL